MCYIPIENKYEIISKIGEGGYGIIYKAREIGTTNIVTLKQIKKKLSESDEGIPQSILREIHLLQELKKHPNIINLKDIMIGKFKKSIYIIYDYHDFDVHTLIYQTKSLSIDQIKSYMKQMIIALQEVHSKGYIHGDIKPGNFLISHKNVIKLIDFGVSKKIDQKNKSLSIGTINYNAPELILGDSDYGIEIDIWSLGCTFYEMITKDKFINCYSELDMASQIIKIFGLENIENNHMIFNSPDKNLILNILKQSNSSIDELLSKKLPDKFLKFKNLLIKMLQLMPKNRISLDDALKDPIFDDTELPENLPLIVLAEKKYKNSYCKKNTPKMKINTNSYHDLRPMKIIPPNFV